MQDYMQYSERKRIRKTMEDPNSHRDQAKQEPEAHQQPASGDIEAVPGSMQVSSGPSEDAGVAAAAAVATPEECLHQQNVTQNTGLSFGEVGRRRQASGRNEFEEDEVDPLSQKFLEQFKDPMVRFS